MPYRSKQIANYLLEKAAPDGGLTPLQVMKLAYIAHGFSLGANHRELLADDIEAWRYGPVIRPIYQFLPAGSQKIPGSLSNELPDFERDDQSLLDSVFEKWGKVSGLTLSSLTHRTGTPWDLTWRRFGQNAIIPRDLIESHFQKVLSGGTSAVEQYGL